MSQLIYASSIARSLENTLLGQEKITRMVFAASYEEGVKVLEESGFGNMSEGGVDGMIAAEEAKLARFMKEVAELKGMRSFLLKNDYHNAKALMKAKYGKIDDPSPMLAPDGTISAEDLKDAVMNDSYNALPEQMAEALAGIDVYFASNPHSGRYIDLVLDKAMYAHVLQVSAKTGSVEKYWKTEIDHANVQTLLRMKKSGAQEKDFREELIFGGDIAPDTLISLYEEEESAVLEKLKYTCVAKAAGEYAASGSFARFEACKDNEQLEIFKKDRYDVFSVAPVAGYYVAKKLELKAVKMITTLLKINADKALIKERLREFYV